MTAGCVRLNLPKGKSLTAYWLCGLLDPSMVNMPRRNKETEETWSFASLRMTRGLAGTGKRSFSKLCGRVCSEALSLSRIWFGLGRTADLAALLRDEGESGAGRDAHDELLGGDQGAVVGYGWERDQCAEEWPERGCAPAFVVGVWVFGSARTGKRRSGLRGICRVVAAR